jgi:hypothetical protein
MEAELWDASYIVYTSLSSPLLFYAQVTNQVLSLDSLLTGPCAGFSTNCDLSEGTALMDRDIMEVVFHTQPPHDLSLFQAFWPCVS